MVDREKLVELLDTFNRDLSPYAGDSKYFIVDDHIELADHLIANGVTVRERGRWITDQVETFSPFGDGPCLLDVLQCSVCGEYFDVSEARNFCPNCGSDMRQRKENNND